MILMIYCCQVKHHQRKSHPRCHWMDLYVLSLFHWEHLIICPCYFCLHHRKVSFLYLQHRSIKNASVNLSNKWQTKWHYYQYVLSHILIHHIKSHVLCNTSSQCYSRKKINKKNLWHSYVQVRNEFAKCFHSKGAFSGCVPKFKINS